MHYAQSAGKRQPAIRGVFFFFFPFFPYMHFSLHISPTTDTEECIGPKSPQCETFAYRRSRRTVSACREIIVGIIALVLDLPLKIAVVSGSLRRSNPHGTQKPWDLVAGQRQCTVLVAFPVLTVSNLTPIPVIPSWHVALESGNS